MKKILLLVGSVLLLFAVPISVYVIGQRQEVRKKAAPATTLSLLPSSISKKVGEKISLEVSIDTADNQVVVAEVHLVYDPLKLEAQTITNGSAFPNILASGVVDRGTASITVGAANNSHPVKGTGTVAVVTFVTLDVTDAPVSVKFASNTFVGGLHETTVNVLVSTSPASITIAADPGATPSITPSPTSTPSATIATTPSPTPILTPSLTPTLAASSSAEASPAAITILSPLADETATKQTPLIKGKALPGATVTLTIYSTPITVVLKADANGNWSYVPDTPLEAGPHNIVASAQDDSGATQTATKSFVVASGDQTPSSQNAIPIAGTVSTTYIVLIAGLILLGSGLTIGYMSK